MAKPVRHDWFLEAWMDHFHFEQVDMRDKTGWSPRKASDLCTGKQRYNRDALNEAAGAMNLAPFELLIHPDTAYEIRALRAAVHKEAVRLVADSRAEYRAEPSEPDRKSITGG